MPKAKQEKEAPNVCVWKAAYNREMPEWLYAGLPGHEALYGPLPVDAARAGSHTRLECRRAGGKT